MDFNLDSNDDAINAFFDYKPNTEFASVQPLFVVTSKKDETFEEIIDHKRETKKSDYAEIYRIKEECLLANQTFNAPSTSSANAMDTSDDDDDPLKQNDKFEDPEIPDSSSRHHYRFDLKPQDLPILKKREEILRMIKEQRVIILSSATGTGKSSQVPQYILEEAHKKKESCNIVVTQPRRIAAISIAKRVALERKCECGTLVGYQVGLDKQFDKQIDIDTRILFCTTGVLLQKLINEKTMKKFTHVILDEVHERDIEMDLLLIIVRRLQATQNPNVKIILMSATLNAEKVADYFKMHNHQGRYLPAPILNLNIPRPFPVTTTYLDSLDHLGVSRDMINIDRPGITSEMYKIGVKTISLILQKSAGQFTPSFLIFLPGIQEFKRFKEELRKPNESFDITEFTLTELHSSIHSQEHNKAFDSSVDRKIILATNIAESSITLSVRFVIDFCLTKYQAVDTALQMTQLKLDWASKQSLEQRAGRVGRIEIGQVVRLIYRDQYNDLPKETVPEMMRASLEQVVLKSKQLEMGKPSSILALALDPPKKSAIDDAVLVLKEIGGITKFSKRNAIEKFDINDGLMTFAGNVMAKLPVDVRVSKLILMGYLFSCLEETIIIGAGLSSKSIFKTNHVSNKQKMEGYHQKLKQAKGSGGDFFAILNAYQSWQEVRQSGIESIREKIWCEGNNLIRKNLEDMNELVMDIENRLKFFRIFKDDIVYQHNDQEKIFFLKICIAGAFYPNYFSFGGKQPSRDEYQTLNNMDPCKTVVMQGMKLNRIGQIYEKQIREVLAEKEVVQDIDELKIKFDSNSSRLFINFKSLHLSEHNKEPNMIPGEIFLEVYKALKLKKLEKKMEIKLMSSANEKIFVIEEELGALKNEKFEFHEKFLKATEFCIFPTKQVNEIHGAISHFVSCSKFFFQPTQGINNIKQQQEFFQSECKAFSNHEELSVGSRSIVKHQNVFKPCVILEIPDEDEESYVVYLKDYGEVLQVAPEDFYNIDCNDLFEKLFEIPPQCFECRLSEIIPSAVNCSPEWSEAAIAEFKNLTANAQVKLKIYSFVDQVASVRAFVYVNGRSMCINEVLIMKSFAQRSDEPFTNIVNHIERDSQQNDNINEFAKLKDDTIDDLIKSPLEMYLTEKVQLDAPFSPLESSSRLKSLFRVHPIEILTEPQSVNHVLLDPYPNDGVEKVLVAATMSKSDNHVTLFNSLIMPHLPGMACFLGLLFSPSAEIRRSSCKTRYSSILTGLGCDGNRKPFFGEHDCLLPVDVLLDAEDIETINNIRRNMSLFMQNDLKFKIEDRKGKSRQEVRQDLCRLIKQLAVKERMTLADGTDRKDWNWSLSSAAAKENNEEVFSYVKAQRIKEMSEENRRDLKRRAEELERKASSNNHDESIFCHLCEERVETIQELQIHVLKRQHKDARMRLRLEPFTAPSLLDEDFKY